MSSGHQEGGSRPGLPGSGPPTTPSNTRQQAANTNNILLLSPRFSADPTVCFLWGGPARRVGPQQTVATDQWAELLFARPAPSRRCSPPARHHHRHHHHHQPTDIFGLAAGSSRCCRLVAVTLTAADQTPEEVVRGAASRDGHTWRTTREHTACSHTYLHTTFRSHPPGRLTASRPDHQACTEYPREDLPAPLCCNWFTFIVTRPATLLPYCPSTTH